MRELATLTNLQDARVLVDYLLTQQIPAVVREEAGKPEVWVRNEDDLEKAKAIWTEFQGAPGDARYRAASKPAQELRKLKEKQDKEYAAKYVDAGDFWDNPDPRRLPVTMAFIIVSIILSVYCELGENRERLNQLAFFDTNATFVPAGYKPTPEQVAAKRAEQLAALERGEVWRLVTPIFLHLSLLHLVLDLSSLYFLSGIVERRRSAWWLIGFILVTAIFSNVCQFFAPRLFDFFPLKDATLGTARFGGMSGVCFALSGYLLSKTLYSPEPGLQLPHFLSLFMLVFMLTCMTGLLGSVANTAHVSGLLNGMFFGLVPKWLKDRRG